MITFRTKITKQLKADLERFAAQDGIQRGIFFDTSGNWRIERVSATSQHSWLFKTKAGQPFKWPEEKRLTRDDIEWQTGIGYYGQ